MEKISGGQTGCIKTLVNKLKVPDADALVLAYSDGRTTHVSALWNTEAIALIKYLKSTDPDEVAADKMRRKIIGLAYEYEGIGANASKAQRQGVVKRLEAWVRKYGHGCKDNKHKAFNAYTVKELPLLVAQFEKVYREFLRKV